MTVQQGLSRRQFLKILAIGGTVAAGLVLRDRLALSNILTNPSPKMTVIRKTQLLMGAVLNLTLIGDDETQANNAALSAVKKMSALVDVCTHYDDISQLSTLNRQGYLSNPDPRLVSILRLADKISCASQGAFDVSIKPLLDAYTSSHAGRLSDDAIHIALQKTGYSRIHIDDGEIHLGLEGMSLTLDGIAKGAVIDTAVASLVSDGFSNVIVEAGGDLMAAGEHAPNLPWKIGLRSPRSNAGLVMPVLNVRNMAVATSGDYLQPLTEDRSIHHILDPRKGISSPELASVTTVAPTAVLADALATAVMVSGPEQGLELMKSFPDCDAYMVTKDLLCIATPGMEKYVA